MTAIKQDLSQEHINFTTCGCKAKASARIESHQVVCISRQQSVVSTSQYRLGQSEKSTSVSSSPFQIQSLHRNSWFQAFGFIGPLVLNVYVSGLDV